MPATPSRIGFITQEFRTVKNENSTMQARYGALARQSEDPIPTFFDSVTDAQTVCDARMTLLATERRLFKVGVRGVDDVLALTYAGTTPVASLVDPERGITMTCMIAEINSIDFSKDQCVLTVWG